MAIFYNHIKGCGKNTTGTTDDLPIKENKDTTADTAVEEVWTWIKWADTLIYTKNPSADLAYVENNPYIYLNNANLTNSTSEDSSLSLGRIITSRSIGQRIHTPFDFKDTMDIYSETTNKVLMTSNKNVSLPIVTIHQDCWVTSGKSLMFSDEDYSSSSYDRFAQICWQKTTKSDGTVESNRWFFNIEGDEGASMEFNASAFWFHKGNVYIGQALTVTSSITSSSHCQALYFNATSDRRAKSNVQPAKFSALDTIKQLPVYTFNYLNDPKPSVGLIAQEAAEHDLDGFNMVDNIDASGEFGDFMQMKESKLVYVLWKAVQELSAEVEDLKSQIASLK